MPYSFLQKFNMIFGYCLQISTLNPSILDCKSWAVEELRKQRGEFESLITMVTETHRVQMQVKVYIGLSSGPYSILSTI